jgi:uncharacterized protein (TIGR00369 family)
MPHDPIRDRPPPGYVPLTSGTAVEDFCGPYYVRDGDGPSRLGFRVQPHHVNARNVCHGGLLSLFSDVLGYVLPELPRRSASAPTISVSVDFLAPAPLGAWIEGIPQTVKMTRKLLFYQSIVTADGEPVARCNGIYRILSDSLVTQT